MGRTAFKGWCKAVRKSMLQHLNPKDNLIMFGLDDYLVIDNFCDEVFNNVMRHSFDRYEMGWGALNKKPHDTLEVFNGYHISRYDKTAPYKSSCQISVWKTEILLDLLDNDWSPWDFEIRGSEKLTEDGAIILGTGGRFALRWQEESCLSFKRNKNRINMLGIKPMDVEELIVLGHIEEKRINYGINYGPKYFNNNLPGKKYREFYEGHTQK